MAHILWMDRVFNVVTIICGHWSLPATRQLDWILMRFTTMMVGETRNEFEIWKSEGKFQGKCIELLLQKEMLKQINFQWNSDIWLYHKLYFTYFWVTVINKMYIMIDLLIASFTRNHLLRHGPAIDKEAGNRFLLHRSLIGWYIVPSKKRLCK